MSDTQLDKAEVVNLTLVTEAIYRAKVVPVPAPETSPQSPLESEDPGHGLDTGKPEPDRSGSHPTPRRHPTPGSHPAPGPQFAEAQGHWSKGGGGAGVGLPDNCPVVPLGRDGRTYFYLDAMRQLVELKDTDHGRLPLRGLFAGKTYLLEQFWPRVTAKGVVNGINFDETAEALMDAAAHSGIWNAEEKIRGAGAWKGDNGELVLHCGDAIRVGVPGGTFEWHHPGMVGKYIYPAAENGPKPFEKAVEGGEHSSIAWALGLIKSWKWHRGELDAMLVLGWIGAAMIGGALKWRPMVWITGGAGTGKSSFQELVKALMGDAIVSVSDTSAAGIWQKLGHATLPVALDELEAEEDNRKVNNVVKLARQAASGGVILRGGADHKGSEFTTRSCFMFSSINVPPLAPQDLSRMAIIELEPLGNGDNLTLDHDKLNVIGTQMRRRLIDKWGELSEILEAYRFALAKVGHSNRGQDQFGTLLAIADVLLVDEPVEPNRCDGWADQLKASDLAAWADNEADEVRCLRHLLTSRIDPFKGGQQFNLVEWIERAAGFIQGQDVSEANRTLGTYGVMVEINDAGTLVYIANQHRGLDDLYRGTHWAGRSGTSGGWVQSMRRLDGAKASPVPKYIGGTSVRATQIDIHSVVHGKCVSTHIECDDVAQLDDGFDLIDPDFV